VASLRIIGPFFGQVEPSINGCGKTSLGQNSEDCHLPIIDLTQSPKVLTTGADRHLALFGKPTLVDNERGVRWIPDQLICIARYCSKPVCRKESKAESQRRWLQCPENQNYFRESENRRRVKDWRKANLGYWRKKKSSTQVPLQEVFQAQVAHNEEVNPGSTPHALQDLFSAQSLVVVGLISMMTGSALQEDIASTVQVLVRKGRDILEMKPESQISRPYR